MNLSRTSGSTLAEPWQTCIITRSKGALNGRLLNALDSQQYKAERTWCLFAAPRRSIVPRHA
jgi:hypothetical protein